LQYKLDKKITRGVLTIVGSYVLISTAWILLSDTLLVNIFSSVSEIRNVSILKGMMFVGITACLLFVIISKYAHELSKTYNILNEDNARLNAVLKMSNQGYYELDIPSGMATASSGYWIMLGYESMPKLTLEWWQESLHPDDRENAVNTLNRCINGEISEYKIIYRIMTKTGGWKTILSAGMVVEYNINGVPERIVGMHTDIEALNAIT
jgi:PAS domain-containing protein